MVETNCADTKYQLLKNIHNEETQKQYIRYKLAGVNDQIQLIRQIRLKECKNKKDEQKKAKIYRESIKRILEMDQVTQDPELTFMLNTYFIVLNCMPEFIDLDPEICFKAKILEGNIVGKQALNDAHAKYVNLEQQRRNQ